MLSIPLDTLGWIIVKAREFDVKADDTGDGDDKSGDASVLEDRADDPTENELTNWIEDMTDTQQAELVALFWLGRGEAETDDFADLTQQAREARVGKTSSYLLGAPLLSDYLEAGLEALGMDVAEVEAAAR